MPRSSDRRVPDIPDLIRRTIELRRELVGLVQRFPEDHLDLADRIFIRLLNPLWRNQIGGVHGPYERKQTEAIHWIEQFVEYLRDLEGCISSGMLRPELFQALPLSTSLHLSATEGIERLVLQEAALKRIQAAPPQPVMAPSADHKDDHRTRLSLVVERYGIEYCASKSGLHRDTISDIATGRVEKPRTKTREKLEILFAILRQAESKTPRHTSPAFRKLQS